MKLSVVLAAALAASAQVRALDRRAWIAARVFVYMCWGARPSKS